MYGAWKLAIFVVVGLGAAYSAIYAAFYGPRARARKRLAVGSSTLEDHTVVTLTGKVRALSTLEAPLTGTPCVAFVAIGSATYGARYDEVHAISTQEMVPFELVTSNGVVLVEATTADIVHAPRTLIPRNVDQEAKFLVAHGFDARMVRTSSFQQAAIEDGDQVQVQGLALVEQAPPSDASGYRETERRVRLVAHGAHPLTIGPA